MVYYKLFALLLFIIFFIVELFTISHYGINWDEPIHYMRGQAFLYYFLTGKKDYNDLPKLQSHYHNNLLIKIPKDIKFKDDSNFRKSIYQYDRENYKFSFAYFINGETGEAGHPPLNDILASFSNYIFYQKLGIIDDIEAYHLFTIFVAALLVGLLFLFTATEFGFFAGCVTALSIVLYPLFFAESHFNIKDPIETAFYALTIISFYKGVIKNDWIWIMLSAIAASLSIGTKFNIFFAFITLFLWVVIYKRRALLCFKWPFSKKVTIALFLYPIIVFGILFISWPYLWDDPTRILNIFSYYKTIGYTTIYQPKEFLIFNNINTYAIQWILFTTPLVILVFSLMGIFSIFKERFKEKNNIGLLILLWFFIPILRVSFLNAGIYGGVRQIMEYIPAMAILAGIGAHFLVMTLKNAELELSKRFEIVKTFFTRHAEFTRITTYVVILLSFIPITLKLISIHPNQNAYFNPFIGGLKGAKEKNFPDWGVTLGSVYKQGVDWINTHAEKDSKLALIRGLMQNVPSITLRSDIFFGEIYYSGSLKKGEYLMEVTDYGWMLNIPKEKREYIETLRPLYEVKVDRVAILTIWKNDAKNTK